MRRDKNTFVLPSRVVIIFFFVVYKIVVVVDLQLPLECDNNTRIYVSPLKGWTSDPEACIGP